MQTLELLLRPDWVRTLVACALLLLLAWLAGHLARFAMIRAVHVASARTTWHWDEALIRRGVPRRLAQVLALLVVRYGLPAIPHLPPAAEAVTANVVLALVALFAMLAVNAALSALEDLYQASPAGSARSLKGYMQLLKILISVVGIIVIIAMLIDRSPLTLLAGLGAVSAVLLLIFKDTILSVVASVQLGSNDMLRLGDWIAMPSANVDGFVVDIALHTVKVQNWDKTISTVPTWHLISHSYRNWRGMYDSGGRRIRRALHIDVTSVHFHTEEELARLRQFNLLKDYFAGKHDEIAQWNRRIGTEGAATVNHRRLSNLGSFRAYMQAYIDRSPDINHDMLCSVRQLDPGADGIPLQIYAYTANTDFVEHEDAQSDIFDHLISILPEFGLALFQQPTGADLRAGLAGSGAASVFGRLPAAQSGLSRSRSGSS
ncbi:MAG: mechanosensitive ion channel [Xanthomonadales bacterium]|nr:mechanosensitive ion channel [Xanthomonadales bacterium]